MNKMTHPVFLFIFLYLILPKYIIAAQVSETCGKQWQRTEVTNSENNFIFFDRISDFSWNGKQWIAVGGIDEEYGYISEGSQAIILSSNDGIHWHQQIINNASFLNKIEWNGELWLAAGNNGTILTSTDGLNWNIQHSGLINSLYDIDWDGKYWVIVGSSGTILTSHNGTKWSGIDSGSNRTLNAVKWNGTQWLAVGDAETVLISPDAHSWQQQTLNMTFETQANFKLPRFSAIEWNGTHWVAIGSFGSSYPEGALISSTDGINWQQPVSPINSLSSIAWNGKQWAVSGNDVVLTSTDSSNWHSTAIPNSGLESSISWNGKKWVLYNSERFFTSIDGENWQSEFNWVDLEPYYGYTNAIIQPGVIKWNGTQFVAAAGYTIFNSPCDGSLEAERLFDWAEWKYPELFMPYAQQTLSENGYWYRYYPATGNYIGTRNNRAYVMGDSFLGLQDVGSSKKYLDIVDEDIKINGYLNYYTGEFASSISINWRKLQAF